MDKQQTWVTADIHLFHKKIMEYVPESRPYADVDEMHETIKNQWNYLIHPDDIVYIVGDVSFGSASKTVEYLNNLHGTKHLIVGNHDEGYVKKQAFLDCFSSVQDYLRTSHDSSKIIMCHYPISSWDDRRKGSLMLHGHLHGDPSGLTGRIMDVGMDTNFCNPYNLSDIVKDLKEKEIWQH